MSDDLYAIAPSFRAARDRWPEAPNLQSHYLDLVKTFTENGSSLLELCKSYLEMVCITIINELGVSAPASSVPTTTELLSVVVDALGLRSERGARAFSKVMSGHNKIADGLNDIRNQDGSVAHGKDGFIDALSDRHARLYLLSTETVLSLILSAYEGVEPSILHTREKHERFMHHNTKINLRTAISAEVGEDGVLVLNFCAGPKREGEDFELRFVTSELLYYLDRQAYMNVINVLQGDDTKIDDVETDSEEIESIPGEEASLVGSATTEPVETETLPEEGSTPAVEESATTGLAETEPLPEEGFTPAVEESATTEPVHSRSIQMLTEYNGTYSELITPLNNYIIHTLLNGNTEQSEQVQNLTYTLLNEMETLGVVDWSKRIPTVAAVRVFIKKLFILFSINGHGQDAVDPIVTWLTDKIEG